METYYKEKGYCTSICVQRNGVTVKWTYVYTIYNPSRYCKIENIDDVHSSSCQMSSMYGSTGGC